MLVLGRKEREAIVLTLPNGEQIIVAVSKIVDKTHVRIGIDAPKNVKIWRSELGDKVNEE